MRYFCCGSICFMFWSRMFVLFEPYECFHILSYVRVTEWPPYGKKAAHSANDIICFLVQVSNCQFRYFSTSVFGMGISFLLRLFLIIAYLYIYLFPITIDYYLPINVLALCGPGSYSDTTMIPCISCETGTYQPEYGSTQCDQCPDGTWTTIAGVENASNCICK